MEDGLQAEAEPAAPGKAPGGPGSVSLGCSLRSSPRHTPFPFTHSVSADTDVQQINPGELILSLPAQLEEQSL